MWSNLFTRFLWLGLCCVGCLFCFVWGVFWLGFFIVLFTSHH